MRVLVQRLVRGDGAAAERCDQLGGQGPEWAPVQPATGAVGGVLYCLDLMRLEKVQDHVCETITS